MEAELRIDLNPKVKPIIKAVLSLRGFLMVLIGLGSLHTGITFLGESTLVAIICFVVFILFIFIGKKFLEQVFFHEYIILNKDAMHIYHKTFLQETKSTFLLKELKHFGFAGQQKYTHNAMHSEVMDITGLQATEKELQYVIDNGTLEIETDNKKTPLW